MIKSDDGQYQADIFGQSHANDQDIAFDGNQAKSRLVSIGKILKLMEIDNCYYGDRVNHCLEPYADLPMSRNRG